MLVKYSVFNSLDGVLMRGWTQFFEAQMCRDVVKRVNASQTKMYQIEKILTMIFISLKFWKHNCRICRDVVKRVNASQTKTSQTEIFSDWNFGSNSVEFIVVWWGVWMVFKVSHSSFYAPYLRPTSVTFLKYLKLFWKLSGILSAPKIIQCN